MSGVELLPCPFCGHSDAMLLEPTCDKSTPYNPADRAFPEVRCGSCFASKPGKDWDAKGDTAIAAWNQRPERPAVDSAQMTADADCLLVEQLTRNECEAAMVALDDALVAVQRPRQ